MSAEFVVNFVIRSHLDFNVFILSPSIRTLNELRRGRATLV
jgi:hypothetical protein